MKLILDERETHLFEKCSQIQNNVKTDGPSNQNTTTLSKRVLHLGDALITTDDDRTVLLLERKSLADLLASIKDGRYEEQSYRLMHADGLPQPHHIIYIVEGMMSQLRSAGEKKMVYSAMTSLGVFKGFSVIRTSSVSETAEWILAMADKVGRELSHGKTIWTGNNIVDADNQTTDNNVTNTIIQATDNLDANNLDANNQDANNGERRGLRGTFGSPNYCTVVKQVKKENVTPQNIGQIILCQIPGISSKSAIAIMQRFTSISQLMRTLETNPNCLAEIMCENNGKSRKLSKTIIQNIRTYLIDAPTVI